MNSTLVMRSIGRQGGTVWTVWCMCAKLHVRLSTLRMEQHAKLLQERVVLVEKHFAELCTCLGAYTRKAAGLRDKNDALAKAVYNYSEAEHVNKGLKNCLLEFSKTLESVGDYRDVEIQRIESNVISELSQYEKLCKHAKEEVKNTLAARDRENARRKQLDRLRERNPRNRPQIVSFIIQHCVKRNIEKISIVHTETNTAAQVELSKASMEVANNMKWLEEQMDHFEKKKLQDIRSLLLSYITAELSFHVKAVELFTKGYNDIANINVNTDLEEFQSFLQDPESSSRLETVKRTSLRQSIANLFATPPSSKRPEQNEPQTTVKNLSMKKSQEKAEFGREYEDDDDNDAAADDDDLSVVSDTTDNHR
ncbi:Uncharacterized protein GBIM_08397 [Gryllus bimaculatus]|nr:Uncharacterized protein GBIM_08397 [Gryllus bimaculatus]